MRASNAKALAKTSSSERFNRPSGVWNVSRRERDGRVSQTSLEVDVVTRIAWEHGAREELEAHAARAGV